MNKKELAVAVADRTGLTLAQAHDAVGGVCEAIEVELAQGGKVQITGFGTWSVKQRAARDGVNPSTGAPLHIPAKKVVKWKTGKTLADAVA